MKDTITLSEAQELVKKYISSRAMYLHVRESEVVMRALAKQLGEDEEFWGIVGLLHDLDMDEIGENYKNHGSKTIEILKQEGYEIPEMFEAILSHTEVLEGSPYKRKTKLDYCLLAGENITGLIYAYGLMRPDKSLQDVKIKSIKKKLKDKSFAANVYREGIYEIEKAGIDLDTFLQLSLNAIRDIENELGLKD